MKIMNYLITLTIMLFFSACESDEYSVNEELQSTELRAEENQEQIVYLELDFHLAFLVREEHQLLDEIVRLEEEIENGGEGHERLEAAQKNLKQNKRDYVEIKELLGKYMRGPIGPGIPGRPCGSVPDPIGSCPMPTKDIGNLYLYNGQWVKGSSIEILTTEGEICGKMVEMEPVSGGGGQFSRAQIDYDDSAAVQIRFTKSSENGQVFSYTIPIE